MGGVDLALYRINFRTKKWYMRLFAQIIDMALTNAWLLYRGVADILMEEANFDLKNFRLSVASIMCKRTEN